MSKKNLIMVTIIILLLIVVIGVFWLGKEKGVQEAVVPKDEQQSQVTQPEPTQEAEVDVSDWKTYRNEEYGFEVKYPSNWELIILNTKFDKSGDDLFFFAKDDKNNFAVFPKGGFGHGIQEPKKITNENFRGKTAEMSWYDYQFPLYTHITGNLPRGWGSENLIDIKISSDDQSLINDLGAVYDSFRFIE